MSQASSPTRLRINLVIGCFEATLVPCLCIAAIATPGGEPFWTWTNYFLSWVVASVVLTVLATLAFMGGVWSAMASAGWSNDKVWTRIAGLLVVWRVVPWTILWALAWLAYASYDPNFNGPLSTGPLPTSLKPYFVIVGFPAVPFVLIGAAVFLAAHRTRALRRQLETQNTKCRHCEYPKDGLPTAVCPECGRINTPGSAG